MVTLIIDTEPAGFETANYLLRAACDELEANPETMAKMSLTEADIEAAKNFRKALVEAVKNSMEG